MTRMLPEITEKKNQHYVPKFYLRKFSYKGNEKQIGLFNVGKGFFFPTATLKNQGSKNFFYGADGVLEDGLSELEGKLAMSLNKVIEERKIPEKHSKEYIDLLAFVGLTHLRNPVIIQNMRDLSKSVQSMVKQLDPDFDATHLFPDIEHQDAVHMALGNLPDAITNMSDLNLKLIINRTKLPFITSDFPVIKYNCYLEHKKWMAGRTGYGNIGLQIFVPLNDELAIMFYDGDTYNVGDRKKDYLGILKEKEVKQLNMLQMLNCLETVYFNDKICEVEIRDIAKIASKYLKPHQVQSQLNFLLEDSNDLKPTKENLIVSGATELETGLKITGISIKADARSRKLTSSAAQLRPLPLQLMMEREMERRKR